VFATSRDPENSKVSKLTDKGNVHVVKLTKQPEVNDEVLEIARLVKEKAGKVDYVIVSLCASAWWREKDEEDALE
jgi:hypothetical protein